MYRDNPKSFIQQKIAILESIAEAWNGDGVNYAVAHSLEGYPKTVGRDLDVLIQADHVKRAISIAQKVLQKHDLTVLYPPPLWGERLVAIGADRQWHDMIEIHSFKRLSWRNVVFANFPNVTEQKGPFKIDPWVSYTKRILMPIVVGDLQRFIEKPIELIIQKNELDIVKTRLISFCGEKLSLSLVEAIEARNLIQLRKLIPKLKLALIWYSLRKAPVVSIAMSIYVLWRKIVQPFAPCAPVVALVGPDGIGKSTVIDTLKNGNISIFVKIIVRHWRPGLLPRLGAFVGITVSDSNGLIMPRRNPGRFHLARLCYYFVDFCLGNFFKDRIDSSRQRLIIYDRCALDMSVDPLRYGLSSSRGTKLLWRITPKPDLIILLYDDPASIHARKPELQKDEIKGQLREWLKLAKEGQVNAIIRVDAPPDEIAQRVQYLVIKSFIQKNGGPVTHQSDPIQWLTSILSDSASSKNTATDDDRNAFNSTRRYGYIAINDGRGYVLPIDQRRAAVKALNLYNAQNRKPRLAKALLSTGLKLGVAQTLLQKVYLANGSLLEYLKEVLDQRDLSFSISLGIPGPHRKPVIQALTSEGKTLAYVKVGWNQATNALVQHEAEVLGQLAEVSFVSFTAPQVLYAGTLNGRYLCVQSAPEGKMAAAPQAMEPVYFKVVNELAGFYLLRMPLKESGFWQELQERVKNVSNAYYRHVLGQGMARVEEGVGEHALPFHFCHGDLTPWNAHLVNGPLWLIDWEYADREAPAAWDLFHYFTQIHWLLRRRSAGRIYQAFRESEDVRNGISRFLQRVGMDVQFVADMFLLYILDRMSFYAVQTPVSFQKCNPLAMMVNMFVYNQVC